METVKALVIDDSRVMRMMVMKSLQDSRLAEFEFGEAENGEDALAKLGEEPYDVLFVDWNMPKMSGIEFVRATRSSSDYDGVPIIMVTSEKTMGKVEEALDQAGANAYICKPFTTEELQKKLGGIFEDLHARK